MDAPELIQQQREIVKRFRKASQQRAQSEASAESRHKQKRTTADVTLQQLEQTAQAQLQKVTTESEAKLSAEKKAAEDALIGVRDITTHQMKEGQTVEEKTESLLKAAGLYSVLYNNQAQPTITVNTASPKTEFLKAADAASKSLPTLEQLIIDLEKARQATLQRRFVFIVATTVAVLLVVSFSYQTWQQRQARLQAQATATAQANATATRVVMQAATATAVAATVKPLIDRFNMHFVPVPAGEFTMGSSNGQGENNEHPQHTVKLEAFLIAVTEVTNAQFRAFVDGDGYRNQHYWTTDGWQWRIKNNIVQPDCWNNSNLNGDNQPVVCVSWYEAVAYVRWLTRQTKLEVRLPSEAEWEKAARGRDGQLYPWGNDQPTSNLLNYDSNVGKPTDVGSYSTGVSPYGALDMAGNVWEWNSTLYKAYPYQADDGRENLDIEGSRLLRGGSWGNDLDYMRGAYRRANSPDYRSNYVGFRLVVSVNSGS